jgi:PAS domain S-box-containing protein
MIETKDMPIKGLMRLPSGRTISILIAVVLALLLLGWWSLRRQDELMRSDLLSDARAAARAIDWRHILSLTASDADLTSKDYQRLKEQLSMVQTAKPEYRFTYLIGQRPDKSIFTFVDSEPPDSKDYSPPGQIYSEATDSFRRIFATGHEAVVGPVENRWGTWVSALVPVTDPKSGKLVAVFGVSRNAADWNRVLAIKVAEQMGLVLMFVLPLAVFLVLQRRNDRIMHESRRFLSDIIQFYPDATLVIDSKGKVTAWNLAMEEFSGVKATEMLGKVNYEYAIPFYGERRPMLVNLAMLPDEEIEGKYLRIERHGNTLYAESYAHNARDKELYFSGTATALRDGRGEIVGAIESMRDMSERKRMEEEIKNARDFYLTLFEKFPALIWRAGTDKKCNYFNDTWLEFTGRTVEQEMGEGWAEGVHSDDLEHCYATYVESFDKREPFEMEYRLRHRSGEYRWIDDFGRSFNNPDGEFAGYIGVCFDITNRKNADGEIKRLNAELEMKVKERTSQLLEAQEELVRKEKLSILGQLSGSVGHELRNPLGVMNNAVYFLKMVLTDADETTREYLDMIKSEIDNSQRIITDLLGFARTKRPQTKMVTARQLLDESLAKCVIPGNVELQIMLPDTLPLLKIDPLQMVQVFQNLITNAVQAMPDGGKLRIEARRVPSPLAGEGQGGGDIPCCDYVNIDPAIDSIEISVSDTGEGIAPENMKKLFQPLFTTKAKGIGLGLVVCRNLTEANGGKIKVESKPGQGATFSIQLPMEKAI